ncbi:MULTISPECIES: GntR family transcriptional regulator [Streptomyces]|uniref:GntR family transcriptional regulator n=1 Tax=Streptomyces TaxID=1883 RepID=UPI000788CCEF|nr:MULTISPECIES: GntR family transcriptional regulator [unclassified Streptomyces]AVH94214.1 GntR family transcriptional regulator [Streptomyces sp. WAC00288]KYG51364.1 GntR family transcriptional regulator [Streptomyces sp. WAC04657]
MTTDRTTPGRLRPPGRRPLPVEVAGHVRELIVSGAVQPGEFLRVERVAESVGVSSTPAREGLLILSSEGLVRLVPHRGFVVSPFTRQDVRDLFWAQARLSARLAARAAQRIPPTGIARLETMLDAYQQAVDAGAADRVADLGHAFHREINLAADSHRLALLLGSVVKHFPNRFYAAIEGQVAATRTEHPLLLDALRRRQAHRAGALMERHILAGADRLVEVLEGRGVWHDKEDPT